MNKFINWWLPSWASYAVADPAHCHGRRFTQHYRRKQSLVKSVWIAAAGVMLLLPALPLVATVIIFTTFLSFVILDETD